MVCGTKDSLQLTMVIIMYRKILNNNKSKRTNGALQGRIGTILGIQDINNRWLKVGDKVKILSNNTDGRILWNDDQKEYHIYYSYSMWYGINEYDVKSYGKSVSIRLDNGKKNDLVFIEM